MTTAAATASAPDAGADPAPASSQPRPAPRVVPHRRASRTRPPRRAPNASASSGIPAFCARRDVGSPRRHPGVRPRQPRRARRLPARAGPDGDAAAVERADRNRRAEAPSRARAVELRRRRPGADDDDERRRRLPDAPRRERHRRARAPTPRLPRGAQPREGPRRRVGCEASRPARRSSTNRGDGRRQRERRRRRERGARGEDSFRRRPRRRRPRRLRAARVGDGLVRGGFPRVVPPQDGRQRPILGSRRRPLLLRGSLLRALRCSVRSLDRLGRTLRVPRGPPPRARRGRRPRSVRRRARRRRRAPALAQDVRLPPPGHPRAPPARRAGQVPLSARRLPPRARRGKGRVVRIIGRRFVGGRARSVRREGREDDDDDDGYSCGIGSSRRSPRASAPTSLGARATRFARGGRRPARRRRTRSRAPCSWTS